MTTPLELAQRLSDSGSHKERVIAVAMITRSLTDDEPDIFKQGWPLDEYTVRRAARYLSLDPTPELVADALALAPSLSDAILNKRASRD